MQGMSRDVQRQLARWIAALVMAALAAIFGPEHFRTGETGGSERSGNSDSSGRSGSPAPGEVSGPARPVDGDSLYVGRDEVRLKGIDAPEGKQTCTRGGASWACGNAARDELTRLIGRDAVTCRATERDKHGRVLGHCSAGGRDLNAGMVASGMALSYGGYLREEGEAKLRKRGLWGSEFQRPRDWRHERGIGL